jgi:hypothetical protein
VLAACVDELGWGVAMGMPYSGVVLAVVEGWAQRGGSNTEWRWHRDWGRIERQGQNRWLRSCVDQVLVRWTLSTSREKSTGKHLSDLAWGFSSSTRAYLSLQASQHRHRTDVSDYHHRRLLVYRKLRREHQGFSDLTRFALKTSLSVFFHPVCSSIASH